MAKNYEIKSDIAGQVRVSNLRCVLTAMGLEVDKETPVGLGTTDGIIPLHNLMAVTAFGYDQQAGTYELKRIPGQDGEIMILIGSPFAPAYIGKEIDTRIPMNGQGLLEFGQLRRFIEGINDRVQEGEIDDPVVAIWGQPPNDETHVFSGVAIVNDFEYNSEKGSFQKTAAGEGHRVIVIDPC